MKPFNLILAPMDGVLDAPLRRVLTSCNSFFYCESEFVRITDIPVTKNVLLKKVPELRSGGVTASATPVYVQFLGQDPQAIATSAKLACQMGALGIDLNFGCPAKQVNRSNGGAALLKDPELIRQICTCVRDTVPSDIPVCAKMRLGFDSVEPYMDIAEKIFSSGVNALCVHGRTKMDEYLPNTVRWDLIGNIQRNAPVTVIANGDIFDRNSAAECAKITGCDHLMLARGNLYIPNLANMINLDEAPFTYGQMVEMVKMFMEGFSIFEPDRDPFPRLKQYLSYLRVYYKRLMTLDIFKQICRCDNASDGLKILEKCIQEFADENES